MQLPVWASFCCFGNAVTDVCHCLLGRGRRAERQRLRRHVGSDRVRRPHEHLAQLPWPASIGIADSSESRESWWNRRRILTARLASRAVSSSAARGIGSDFNDFGGQVNVDPFEQPGGRRPRRDSRRDGDGPPTRDGTVHRCVRPDRRRASSHSASAFGVCMSMARRKLIEVAPTRISGHSEQITPGSPAFGQTWESGKAITERKRIGNSTNSTGPWAPSPSNCSESPGCSWYTERLWL